MNQSKLGEGYHIKVRTSSNLRYCTLADLRHPGHAGHTKWIPVETMFHWTEFLGFFPHI